MFGKSRKPTGNKAAISKHPAFPAVVALWFAALLGLGSLVLPVMLFEKLATATGLSSVFGAAAPPLGMTARLSIAGIAAIAGAVVGILIARKVAAAQGNTTPERSTSLTSGSAHANDPGQKRPISAHEELGSEYLDAPIADSAGTPGRYTGRRRALAVTDDSGPSEFLENAPLPGDSIMIDPDSTLEDTGDVPAELGQTLDLEDLGLMEEVVSPDEHVTDPSPASAVYQPEPEPELPAAEDHCPSMVGSDSPAVNSAEGPSHYDQESKLTPREELAAMTDRLTTPIGPTAYNPFSKQPGAETITPNYSAPVQDAADNTPDVGSPNQAVLDKSLSDLGMVELVERFAMALQKKTTEDAKAEPPEPALYNPLETNITDETEIEPPVFRRSNPVEPAPVIPTPEPEHIKPLPAFAQGAFGGVPSSLQPMTLDDEEEEEVIDDLGLSLNVAPNRFSKPDPVQNGAAQADESNSDFTSPLSLKTPLNVGQEFVRVDAEFDRPNGHDPVVVFPGHGSDAPSTTSVDNAQQTEAVEAVSQPRAFDAPQGMNAQTTPPGSNGEAEKALREALEKLQKMSGAA